MREATLRDVEYIENRLLAPAVDCSDAIERLREVGQVTLAQRLDEALADFTESCRDARRRFADARRVESQAHP